jgi:hypothetical protein
MQFELFSEFPFLINKSFLLFKNFFFLIPFFLKIDRLRTNLGFLDSEILRVSGPSASKLRGGRLNSGMFSSLRVVVRLKNYKGNYACFGTEGQRMRSGIECCSWSWFDLVWGCLR